MSAWNPCAIRKHVLRRIAGIDRDYPNLIRVPVPVNVFEAVVFTHRQRSAVHDPESLKPYTRVIRIGSKYAEHLTQGLNVTRFPDFVKLSELLAEERYDVGIASRVTGLYQIKHQRLAGIVALEPPLAVYELFHYLLRDHRVLVPRVTHTLEQMAVEGFIERVRPRAVQDLLASE